MTDETPLEQPDEARDEEQPDVEPPADEQPADDDRDDGRAAKYRRRAQAAEAERDTLRTQLDTARRGIVEDACGLTRPAGLWAAGVDPNTLFDDDGRLDHDKLTEAVSDAVDRLGLTRAPRTPKPDLSAGSNNPADTAAAWGDIFTRRK